MAAAVGAATVAVDRAMAHGWLATPRLSVRRRTDGDAAAATGALGDLVELFQPSRVHLVAERQRQRTALVLPGDAAPPGPVDRDRPPQTGAPRAARTQDLPVQDAGRPPTSDEPPVP